MVWECSEDYADSLSYILDSINSSRNHSSVVDFEDLIVVNKLAKSRDLHDNSNNCVYSISDLGQYGIQRYI